MELPVDIKDRILEYLHLEYGEDSNDPNALTLEQISYEGEYEIHGVNVHYFKYESSSGRNWATVEPYGDSYAIGMTSKSPTPVRKREIYRSIRIENTEDGEIVNLDLEDRGGGCYGFSNFKEIAFRNGKTFQLLTEVTPFSHPNGVVVAIQDEGNDVYIRGSLGLAIRYESTTLGAILITLGTGPWE